MIDVRIEIAANWLKKAKNDIISARKLSTGNDITLDTAIYHCQQAAEKSLKGFLFFHNVDVPRTHDLRVLISLSVSINREFENLFDLAELLNPYSTEYRYPDDIFEPDFEEFENAYNASKSIFSFVVNKLNFNLNELDFVY